jgi:hypothetical protein
LCLFSLLQVWWQPLKACHHHHSLFFSFMLHEWHQVSSLMSCVLFLFYVFLWDKGNVVL